MKITWQGHSCFIVEAEGKSIIIDPFLKGNPTAKIQPSDVRVNAVLVTHGHGDHLGDAVEISKLNGAPVIGTFELVNYCTAQGATGHPMHIGGSYRFPFGRVKLTIAHHGSSSDAGSLGNPCGFIINMGGKSVYHAGDTGLFSDMALIGDTNSIDVAMLPIGDNFTMGIEDAVLAVGFLKPKTVIPMHYNTFDLIKQDPEVFRKSLPGSDVRVEIMKPGESLEV